MSDLPSAIGPYQITGRLGQGRRSLVLSAVAPGQESRVALKVFHATDLPADAAAHLATQARMAARVDHPGVVRVHGSQVTADGQPYLTMELVAGETLGHRLCAQRCLPLTAVLRLGRQLAAALTALHAQRIVHRDVEPENVMITPDASVPGGERIKLCDFGLAKLLPGPDSSADEDRVAVGMPAGTPLYMSPEHWRSAREVDAKGDVYSLGVILYSMLAGETPFPALSDAKLMALHILSQAPSLAQTQPATPKRLVSLVKQMLEKAPAARPTMVDVEVALAELDTESADRAHLSPAPALPSKPAARLVARSMPEPRVRPRPLARYPVLRQSLEEAERDAGMVMEPYLSWLPRAHSRVHLLTVLAMLLAAGALAWAGYILFGDMPKR